MRYTAWRRVLILSDVRTAPSCRIRGVRLSQFVVASPIHPRSAEVPVGRYPMLAVFHGRHVRSVLVYTWNKQQATEFRGRSISTASCFGVESFGDRRRQNAAGAYSWCIQGDGVTSSCRGVLM